MAQTFPGFTLQAQNTQAALKSRLIVDAVSDCKYGNAAPMTAVYDQYANSPVVGNYTPLTGSAITEITGTQSGYLIDQIKAAAFAYDPIQNLQVQDPNWSRSVEDDGGYQLARNVDQYGLQKAIAGAYNNITGVGTLTPSSLRDLVSSMRTRISSARGNAMERKWIAMDPATLALIPNDYLQVQTGATADLALMEGCNGFIGKSYQGFDVYETNEYLYSVVLTMGTNPTAGQVLTFFNGSFTITFVSALTGAANEVLIDGGGVAGTQNNLEAFLNQAAGAGSTYGAMTAEDSSDFKNAQFVCGNFSGNAATLSRYGRIDAATNVTSATLGNQTHTMVGGVYGALDMTILEAPMLVDSQYVTTAGNATAARTLQWITVFGGGVYHRRKKDLVAAAGIIVS